MTFAELITEYLHEHGVAAQDYSLQCYPWNQYIDISWRNQKTCFQIQLVVNGSKVVCDSMYRGMKKAVLERSIKIGATRASIDLADPDSLGKILKAIRECTTGNCTECAFAKGHIA